MSHDIVLYGVLYTLLSPLLAFGIVSFIGRRLPRGGDWVSLGAIFSGLGISLYLLITLGLRSFKMHPFSWKIEWLNWGSYRFSVGIYLDEIALIMLVVVTLISALVHLYSVGYMKGDPKYSRFFAFLSFFSFSMLGLVLADNLLILFCFWELVGLSSYLLIGFWHERLSAAQAAVKAFVVNRVGDAGMLLGILLVFSTLQTLQINNIYAGVEEGRLGGKLLTIAGLLLFTGAIGKSAQFPLHVWLPDAMEGPTPVSALIHAATMVAAGVYLTARIFPILTPEASVLIAYVGGFTALFSATIALAQNDIKRVLAYSTISQLGYMIMALGVGSYTAGFFHLVTHAMFKACLFLGSGSVIHSMHYALHKVSSHADPQDIRNMGGLKTHLPITFYTFLIATLALSGIPLTSGFLSKDAILGGTLAFVRDHPKHFVLAIFGFGGAGLTAFYMFRLVWLVFAGSFRGGEEAKSHLHESPPVMLLPLVILSALCAWFIFTLPSLNFATPEGGWFEKLVETPERVY
ncbi:MAG: NADH-quinone oxidoreductase subunit L, partial [bacterium]